MRTGIEPSKALPGSAAEEFGPLFATPYELAANRRVVDLNDCEEKFISWHLVEKNDEGIVLRDGVDHWMEETLWMRGRTPGCTYALHFEGVEYEFSRLLARRSIHAEPASRRSSNRPQGRQVTA